VYYHTSNAFLGDQIPSASCDERSWRLGLLVCSMVFRFFWREKNLALLAPGTTGCGERREVGVPLV